MNLRQEARNRPCQVRLQGCLGGGETVVLSHYRMSGYCGTGMKPDDLAFGAWACSECHDRADGRKSDGMSREAVRLAHAEGVMRTIAALRAEGKV